MSNHAEETVTEHVACTACACVCDDLRITVADGRIVGLSTDCPHAVAWFASHEPSAEPAAVVRDRPVSVTEAVRAAAAMLRSARAPLIYGLSRSSTDGQRAAVALADFLGATIDTTASEGHAPSILALQQSGESTCSLGEVKNRADLVIYWGSDPVVSHPRHLERYSLEPKGELIPNGRADRTLVVIDVARTATAELADVFVQVEPGRDFAALWTLRGLLQGIEPSPGTETGVPLETLRDLAERMKTCRSGVIFFGYGVARQPLGHRNVEALLRLVIDLNAFTRFYARRMRVLGDVSGADNVLCWQTGYPFSVNLARGYPRYNPGEFSAGDLLAHGEADAVLFVGTDRIDTFPPAARERLTQIPTIVLERANCELPVSPTVRVTTAVYGIHLPGTAYRMDEVPIPLRTTLPQQAPSDGDILRAILAELHGEKSETPSSNHQVSRSP